MVFMYALYEGMYWFVYHLLFKTTESTTVTEAKSICDVCLQTVEQRWQQASTLRNVSHCVRGLHCISCARVHMVSSADWFSVGLIGEMWNYSENTEKKTKTVEIQLFYDLLPINVIFLFFLQIRLDWCEGWMDYCSTCYTAQTRWCDANRTEQANTLNLEYHYHLQCCM